MVVKKRQVALLGRGSSPTPQTVTPAFTPGAHNSSPARVFSCQPIDLIGDPGMTRTCDLRFRKPSLYPAELRDREPDRQTTGRNGVSIAEHAALRQLFTRPTPPVESTRDTATAPRSAWPRSSPPALPPVANPRQKALHALPATYPFPGTAGSRAASVLSPPPARPPPCAALR